MHPRCTPLLLLVRIHLRRTPLLLLVLLLHMHSRRTPLLLLVHN
jgi:hypothetical protein